MYAFSQRVSVERPHQDGTVEKVTVFRYEGLYEAADVRLESLGDETCGNEIGIVNLTQHPATEAQMNDGVKEPSDKNSVRELLTFTDKPNTETLVTRAEKIADIAVKSGCSFAMIGGMGALMGPLEDSLRARGITPLYAFSEQKVERMPDGTTKSTFEHKGFVETPDRGDFVRDDDQVIYNDDDNTDIDFNDLEDDDFDTFDSVD